MGVGRHTPGKRPNAGPQTTHGRSLSGRTGLREKEPINSLDRIRRWDGKAWFGINLVPDPAGVTIRSATR